MRCLQEIFSQLSNNQVYNQKVMSTLTIHTDGGSRGNPGPAAAGVAFYHEGVLIHELSKYLGHTTNNQAEYQAVLLAISYLEEHPEFLKKFSDLKFVLDSELVVRQLIGRYQVKNPDLLPLYRQVLSSLSNLHYPTKFEHVLRHLNKQADFLVNQELDRQ